MGLDTELLRMMRTTGHHGSVERAVERFSKLGEHGAIWLATSAVGALASPPQRPAYLRAARTVAVAFAANQLIKVAVRRRRPQLDGLPRLTSTKSNLSYPSAHATTSFAGAHALSAVLPAAPLYALATALTLSRTYLGVHYPSDTLAGSALGSAIAELAR